MTDLEPKERGLLAGAAFARQHAGREPGVVLLAAGAELTDLAIEVPDAGRRQLEGVLGEPQSEDFWTGFSAGVAAFLRERAAAFCAWGHAAGFHAAG